MSGAGRLALKEARDVMRERTIVLALVVQLFVAAFSAFLAVGLVALYDPSSLDTDSQLEVGYAGPGGFDDQIADNRAFQVVEVGREEGIEAFRAGEIDALAVEQATNDSEPRRVHLRVPQGELRSTLIVNELKSALDTYEHELRQERSDRLAGEVLRVEGPDEPSVSFNFAYGVLLPLLVAAPAFLSGAITADSLSDEINEGTLLLLRSTPLSPAEIVTGKLATPVLLVPAQVALWMGMLWLNGLPTAAPLVVLAAATALGAILCACGVIVGAIAQREGPTQAGYTLVVLALAGLSVLLPQDPANLIARAGVGTVSTASWVTLGVYLAVAGSLLAAAVKLVSDRLAADRLTPGGA